MVSDCETLLELRDTLAGDGTLNWSNSISLWAWQGVVIGDSPPRLVELQLGGSGLTGVIPPELGRLEGLRTLNLSHNELTGAIPPQLSNLANLHNLLLHVNKLTGAIPLEFANLKDLANLDLGQNQLSGPIPQQLGDLAKLEGLYLGANYLTGRVPSELVDLSNLRRLDVSGNNLSGCVPDELKRISINSRGLRFCGDPDPVWPHRPVFEGGIDLGVTYIERLPRYQKYQLAYFRSGDCPYPFDEFKGPALCPGQADLKRWPDPEEPIELIAYVWNFGDRPSGPFEYEWKLDDKVLETDRHEGLESGESTEFVLFTEWPDEESNPTVTFAVDTQNKIDELIEDNNTVVDWIKGYTLGFYFSPIAYESLTLSNMTGRTLQSPEHWVHNNIGRLNEMLAEAGLEDRVRAELFFITDDHLLHYSHDLRWYMDGWWSIWHFDTGAPEIKGIFNLENYRDRPDIEYALLHELMHQLGTIDLYRLFVEESSVLLPDANRPGKKAGCGTDYWYAEWACYRLPQEISGIMARSSQNFIGVHTAGGLRSNNGHRRGFYGEYLYDTPETTVLKIVDQDGKGLPNISLRLFQYEYKSGEGHVLDAVPEFELTTDGSGSVVLPNRGITGIVTETGHQLRPNPFGVIDVTGTNGTFLIELQGACTNYEWLTIVELNLAYWRGDTDEAVFTKKLLCPPP
ncbi:MAG: hypothetical protein OXP10_04955 [Chloroflexota bacterium]|nr:hypothetical protein [Chloroflexota bacterium]MDE2941673.1 hypothetical protein [Chloroflexota bacterium]